MTRFMLDTNAASGLVKGQPKVTARFKAEAQDRVCLSAVTEGEMLFGVARRPEARRLRAAVNELLAAIDVLPWTSATARRYATLRAGLERQGRPLSALDLMIAAHAAEHDMTLVTHDGAFGAVPGLRIEDWTQA
jgi:tRNA(fMet)-specific endonuclease VapC